MLGVLGAVMGCGPSFQATYECEVRFEHCYAYDQGSGSVDAKKDCWREWLHGYTYGQPSDRVEYAATRFSELSLDPTLPTIDTGARPRHRSVAAPMPTNAFAPPPNVAESKTAATPAPVVAAAAPVLAPLPARAPAEICTNACVDRWNACRNGCKDGACDACDHTYRACVPACFQDRQPAARSLR